MATKTLRYGRGYAGKMGNKCWIARITGSDKKFGLAREFVEPASVEREHFNRPRTMIDFRYHLDAGLYEYSEGGDRAFLVVWRNAAGAWKMFRPTEDRIKQMLALMDGGMTAEEARVATKEAPKQETPNV